MKVFIGPYRDWIGPYQLANKIFFWVNRRGIFADEPAIYNRWDYKMEEKFGEWLANIDWFCNFLNWISSKKKRKIKVHIDQYDTWSMDHTLAHIIHPMLLQLRGSRMGSAHVEDEDVPESMRSTAARNLSEEDKELGVCDEFVHVRWDWVLGEMVWSFEQLIIDNDEKFYKDGKVDIEGIKAHNKRMDNGFRLFGKYYQGLWD